MALSFFCNNGFLGVCQKVKSKGELGPSLWDTSCVFMLTTWACVLCSASWWALVTSGLCYGGVCIFLGYRVLRLRLKTTKAYSRGPSLAACTSDARYRSLQSKSYFLTRELKFSQRADILGGVQKDSHEGTSLSFFFSFFSSPEQKENVVVVLVSQGSNLHINSYKQVRLKLFAIFFLFLIPLLLQSITLFLTV